MLQNYFKVALRNLLKNRRFTFINVLGLAIGMACCLLILLYVADERGYDRHWPDGERIYRMSLTRIYPDRRTGYAIIPPSYAQSVKNECPEVEEVVRIADFANDGSVPFKVGDRVFEENNVLAADSTFFSIFKIPFLHGKPDEALTNPNGAVLTASTAQRFFGKTDILGSAFYIPNPNGPRQLEVTGVCEDLPEHAHFDFDLLLSTKGVGFLEGANHISFAANTYFLLRPGSDAAKMEAKFPDIVEKYAAGEIQRNFGVSWPDYKKAGNGYHYYLVPLRDIHLHSHLEAELKPPGNATMVQIFTLIACFILLLACVNFMNLATARSAERAREVGIRKTLGGERGQLARQFLMEALLVTLASAGLAVGIVSLVLPAFNTLADKTLTLGAYLNGGSLLGLLGFAAIVGLLAGSYPAGVLSGFMPLEVLKGKFSAQKRGAALRNGLVVFQFSVSIAMMVCTLVVFRQLGYISNKQLGFEKDHVVKIANAGFLGPQCETFKQELERLPGVLSVGGASDMPGGENFFGISFKKPEDNETVTGRGLIVDDRLVQALGMQVSAGRGFSKEFNDSLSVVLNERAVRDLALGADPIGKRVVMPGSFFDPNGGAVSFTVVGVVRDFHFQSLHESIVPLFFLYNRIARGADNLIAVRVQPEQVRPFLEAAAQRWAAFMPNQSFQYTFLDADLAALYASEQRAQRIFGLFALLAVFIACIGLLGLAAYMTQQRVKEIGVRKVLGASTIGIVGLLAKDFLKLVGIALVLASPIAYWFMGRWLSDFAYRIELQWWMFAVAGAAAVAIAFLTVSFQSIKAALANPVKSLRSE